MLAGMIAGAMAGGANAVGQIADTQVQQNARKDLAKFESDLATERATAVARLQQTIGREDTLYNTTGEGGKAKLAFAKDELKAKSDAEREGLAAYATDQGARAGVRAKTADSETSASRAAAAASAAQTEATRYGLTKRRELDDALGHAAGLYAAGDKAGAEDSQRVAQILAGQSQPKSFSDATAAAKILMENASALLDPLKGGDPTNPDNIAEAAALRKRAADMASDVGDRKGVGSGRGGGSAAPYKEGTRLVGPDGKLYVVKGGKPVLEGK